MSELSIDSYFDKLNDLSTLCLDPLTTATLLNNCMNELSTINNTIETELETLPFPTTTSHLRKLILLELERNDNSFIQSNLLKLISIKENYMNEYVQTNYPTVDNPVWDATECNNFSMGFSLEIGEVKSAIKNIINGCNCMKNRKNIIENIRCLNKL